jgi:hypothetical protein
MAQLTWRNVEAPNIRMGDFALATAGITDAFSRLGSSLQGVNDKRVQADVDAQLAGFLRMTNPEDIAAGLANVQGPNAAKVLQGAQAHRASMITTDAANQERLNTIAAAESGDEAAQLQLLAWSRDDKGLADYIAQQADNPHWARVGAGIVDDVMGTRNNSEGRFLEGNRDKETIRSHKANEADAAAARAIQRSELALRQRELEEAKALRKLPGQAVAFGDQFASGVDASVPLNDALVQLRRTQEYGDALKLGTAKQMEDGLTAGYQRRMTPTTAELSRTVATGGVPGTGGMPSFMLPAVPGTGNVGAGSIASIDSLLQQGQAARGDINVGTTALRNRAEMENPYLAVERVSKGMKTAPTFPDVVKFFEDNTDVVNAESHIQGLQKRYPDVSNADMLAIAQTIGLGSSFSGGGHTELERRVRELHEGRTSGRLAEQQKNLQGQLAPLEKVQSQLDAAEARIQREAAKGDVSQAALAARNKLLDEVAQLRAAAIQ